MSRAKGLLTTRDSVFNMRAVATVRVRCAPSRTRGLDADDLDLRLQRLHVSGDAGDEAAAAHRYEDGVQRIQVRRRLVTGSRLASLTLKTSTSELCGSSLQGKRTSVRCTVRMLDQGTDQGSRHARGQCQSLAAPCAVQECQSNSHNTACKAIG